MRAAASVQLETELVAARVDLLRAQEQAAALGKRVEVSAAYEAELVVERKALKRAAKKEARAHGRTLHEVSKAHETKKEVGVLGRVYDAIWQPGDGQLPAALRADAKAQGGGGGRGQSHDEEEDE